MYVYIYVYIYICIYIYQINELASGAKIVTFIKLLKYKALKKRERKIGKKKKKQIPALWFWICQIFIINYFYSFIFIF
jgi:hypothetical protein